MQLLDTDTLTHLHAGHARVMAHLQSTDDPDVGTTIITKIELLQGRFDYLLKAANGTDTIRTQQLLIRTEELLSQTIIVSVDQEAGVAFDRLRTIKGLHKIGRSDLLIASIALAQRATLVTRNRRHFSVVPGLRIVNWVDD